MNESVRRWLVFIIMAVMLLGICPVGSALDGDLHFDPDGDVDYSDYIYGIKRGGEYAVTGKTTTASIYVDADKVKLTLNGANVQPKRSAISSKYYDVEICVKDKNATRVCF